MQHPAVAFACGEAFCRSSDSAAVLDDLAVGFATASCCGGVTGGRSRSLFREVGTVSGALPGSVTVTVTGAVAIKKKKSLDLFFLAGQSQSHIAIGVGKRSHFAAHEILRL